MKGFLKICGLFLISCFANETAMAQSAQGTSNIENQVRSKSDPTSLLLDSNNMGKAEDGTYFDPEKNGYVKTEENGQVIYVKQIGQLNIRYQPK